MGRVLTDDAKWWKESISTAAKFQMRKFGLQPIFREKFAVNIWAWWRDKRSQLDADGCQKLVLDAMNGIVYSSDKFALPRFWDYGFDEKNPRMLVEVLCPPPHAWSGYATALQMPT